ncbi:MULTISPECIES: helix-turn-helix domain-containing protein [Gordonibacter]|uniref:Helix-turn-helix transcriptional regulator n=1 Tax=Gordonibacter faecis TaxID=3047475 RepID=A0ABT7DL06_9ACTN|nr:MULTISPECIES: helix-turn-helix transcriptional regulator [unclassified Gordonibacter]MDJ1650218.1 helix-turn-helix transcriptional regulator [Gordonibacter sp. KGMB12511]HIW75948.1 helix-turn-helix domain-containing protein [Candidatus Gordonibacter avicola]
MKRPVPAQSRLAAKRIGENIATWRKLVGMTAEELAAKAAVSRGTISRLESGDPTVSFATILNVCRSLDILDRVVDATDPYETDLGRARSDQKLPQRVRRPS